MFAGLSHSPTHIHIHASSWTYVNKAICTLKTIYYVWKNEKKNKTKQRKLFRRDFPPTNKQHDKPVWQSQSNSTNSIRTDDDKARNMNGWMKNWMNWRNNEGGITVESPYRANSMHEPTTLTVVPHKILTQVSCLKIYWRPSVQRLYNKLCQRTHSKTALRCSRAGRSAVTDFILLKYYLAAEIFVRILYTNLFIYCLLWNGFFFLLLCCVFIFQSVSYKWSFIALLVWFVLVANVVVCFCRSSI